MAEKPGHIIQATWNGPLYVGQYGGGPSAPYQVNGWISGLRIYNRVVNAEEAANAFKQKPADPK